MCTVNITSIVELVLFFSKWLGARVHWRWRGTCWEGTLKWEFRVTTLYDHIIQPTTGIYNFTYVYMNGAYETKTVHICKIPKRMWLFLPSNGSMKTSMCPMDFGTTLAPQFSSFQVERANKDLAQLDRQCLTQQGCNWLTNFCYTCEKKHVKRETPHKNWWFGWMFLRFQIFKVVFSDSHGSFWGWHHGTHLGIFLRAKKPPAQWSAARTKSTFEAGNGVEVEDLSLVWRVEMGWTFFFEAWRQGSNPCSWQFELWTPP